MAIIIIIWAQAPLSEPLEGASLKYLRYQQQVERDYVKRISTLLSSLLNQSDLHIQVNTEVDFLNIPFKIKRLAVIVIFNERLAINNTRLGQLADLIEQAVGIDTQRGDSLSLTHLPFHHSSWDALSLPLLKQLFSGVLLIGLILILWTVVRTLSRIPNTDPTRKPMRPIASEAVPETPESSSAAAFESFSEQVSLARQIAEQDPKHVAQIVKLWIANND